MPLPAGEGRKWAQCRPPRALLLLHALAQGGLALLLSVSWLDSKFSGQGWCPVELCPHTQPDFRLLSLVYPLISAPSPLFAPASASLLQPSPCLPLHHTWPSFWPLYLFSVSLPKSVCLFPSATHSVSASPTPPPSLVSRLLEAPRLWG